VEFFRDGLEETVAEDSRMARSRLLSSFSSVTFGFSTHGRLATGKSSPSHARRTFLAYVLIIKPLKALVSNGKRWHRMFRALYPLKLLVTVYGAGGIAYPTDATVSKSMLVFIQKVAKYGWLRRCRRRMLMDF
jgi:hypothetical protein